MNTHHIFQHLISIYRKIPSWNHDNRCCHARSCDRIALSATGRLSSIFHSINRWISLTYTPQLSLSLVTLETTSNNEEADDEAYFFYRLPRGPPDSNQQESLVE
jgi:hypothetical protein